jgi:Protein of unknown function (DUF1364)
VSKLRKSARGRDCQIRIPGICTGNPETVVLCHLPGGGMGGKMPDLFGAFGCAACHDAVDGRIPSPYPTPKLMRWFYEGVFRTQQIWLDEGFIR